ncbi:GTP 3',8-cyclase MoaA [Herbaspirillum sp. ST 5-3]|uniref:GTP 3',8-cyclase MoaA n=1 Tax=Oxalobacteraceae TaxID=75682 RepID=UPI0010A2DE32|nr:GTP 3',8-cyclase MoaA [Herbaspirillum sp. ST 5-3]
MLTDGFGRTIEYLRLSVTDRCDLRCSYCLPKGFHGFEEPAHWLSFDEIERVVRVFARLGVQRIRLTGGEPLMRKNLPELAARISATPGISDLSLSTNATQLEKHAHALRAAGVTRLNVSIDSLDPGRFAAITQRDVLQQVLRGLDAARREGFSPIKINMVAMAGITDEEIDTMVAFCMEQGFILRLIEVMPVGESGRNTGMLELGPTQKRLRVRFGLVDGIVPGAGPARYLVSQDRRFQIGFITPISQHFCATCNRVRLGVDGTLYLCLGQNDTLELRTPLRDGCSDGELEALIRAAILRKPLRHEFKEQPSQIVRFMSSVGG